MAYASLLARYPYTTRMTSFAATFLVSDTVSQHIDGTLERGGWDRERALRMTVWGGLLFAPALHRWFSFIDKRIPGRTARDVLMKTTCDQLAFGPSINAGLITYNVLARGGTPSDAFNRLRDDLPRVLSMQYCYWPAVHLINFRLIPPVWRSTYVQTMFFPWSIFLTWFNNRKVANTEDKEAKI
eukprot:TRINITY_DN19672_c0_g1_i1.p1 TRINITY_DN19672_c0_g1~~TRINITY_DN19672_c0_g1_i1.p1  ORF type:complete len:203 (-),score=48.49 TRINITY_DN19672_c0_g1_i1:123-674(-)